jgi:hypothetical protein
MHPRPHATQFGHQALFQKTCPLCKAAGRPHQHFLSKCTYLPESDRKYMAKACLVIGSVKPDAIINAGDQIDSATSFVQVSECSTSTEPSTLRVQVCQSPFINLFYEHFPTHLTIDSGATGNMIRASVVKHMGVDIQKTPQSAHQADGLSSLKAVGKTRLTFTRDTHKFYFEGLVVENLDIEILAGMPFMQRNDIHIRPARHQVFVGDHTVYEYGSNSTTALHHTLRHAHIRRAPPQEVTIWPGKFVEIELPEEASTDSMYALEPRVDCTRSCK